MVYKVSGDVVYHHASKTSHLLLVACHVRMQRRWVSRVSRTCPLASRSPKRFLMSRRNGAGIYLVYQHTSKTTCFGIGMNPNHLPLGATFNSWEECAQALRPDDDKDGDASVRAAALRSDGHKYGDVPEDFVGDEDAADRQEFRLPTGPWRNGCDILPVFQHAASISSHRFKCCSYSSGHTSSKSGYVVDWKVVYCCCPQPPTEGASKFHAKSYCPFKVSLKLDKKTGQWDIHGSPELRHTCHSMPDLSITATGMTLIRRIQEFTAEELAFMQHQFDFVGTVPRVIQYNFTQQFPGRKPDSNTVVELRRKYQEDFFGFQAQHVQELVRSLKDMETNGGIGHIDVDSTLKIARLTIVRPDMMPFLKRYHRVLVCDATHGITMQGFKLFTVVVVDSLLRSALVAYAFIRNESADDLRSVFQQLRPHLVQEGRTVFVSDDNPAAGLLCEEFGFIHLLCQWHYAKAWVKNCTSCRMTRADMFGFADAFYDVMRGTNFGSEAEFDQQMKNFEAAVLLVCPQMATWLTNFQKDKKLVCEYFREGLYTAG